MRYVILVLFSINLLSAQVAFEESAQQLGISINCEYTFLGNGITFFDYDNDGLDDITVATALGDPIYFYKNINGNFVSQTLNISNNNARNKQINWVDIDNDGDNDLFITSDESGNRLFENLGNMIMSEITSTSGMLTDNFPYYGASWGDYNNDGFLDVFISIRDPFIPNILYRNNGDKTFTLANVEAGLLTDGYMSFCSAFIDYDNDGDQDIYVANDKYANPNLMYRNNGDGTFTEVGNITGTDVSIDAMSVTVEDFNYDGWLDIYITNDPSNNILFVNNGDGTFTDMAQSYQVTFNSSSWGAVFLDADNDKDLDLYVSGEGNGTVSPFLSSAFYENINSSLFQLNNNAVPGDFAYNYGNATGDVDNDGYPEIVVNNIDHENIFLWKNTTNTSNNWLKVKLEGTTSNRNGIGSFIEISINANKQYRYTCLGEGYLSQNSATEQFGLGTETIVDYVKVKWLSGIEDIFYNVSPNQTMNIIEGSSLSIDEQNLNTLKYYPNPSNGKLTIESKQILEEITIYNLLGEKVMQIQPNSLNCNLSTEYLYNGVYKAQVKTINRIEVFKLIVKK
ncbi:FG-GAP-like repeat-containing protein [Winogradskyella sp. KYW1333]|uniref:FG-GAP-like repeat-containing protein n=1 Tax=Winogradskyella sp. KYW1333 TaxID=2282123 RepID=UPI0015F122F9|nr:FG-GAP-like repeat-containing protein [Winogradskyella sp. KYW1333]